MQEEWLAKLEGERSNKPHLDLVLTHVDDRFDTGMRDAIGADAARVLPLLDRHAFTFLVEDPATVWHLGPQRYQTIAERYRALTTHREKLAIDLNIVDRYQDVYPTKQQTGTELFQLVHSAAANFSARGLVFRKFAAAAGPAAAPVGGGSVTRMERMGGKTVVESAAGVGIPWKGPALVDGQAWPAADAETVWLPAGAHSVEAGDVAAEAAPGVAERGFEGGAHAMRAERIEFSYQSSARAIAVLDRAPQRVEIDGAAEAPALCRSDHNFAAAGPACRDIGASE